MSFTSAYDGNEIIIDNYVFSGVPIGYTSLMPTYEEVLNRNSAFQQAGTDTREGPLKNPDGSFETQGIRFQTGVYVLKENLKKRTRTHPCKDLPLRQAFDELQQALSE